MKYVTDIEANAALMRICPAHAINAPDVQLLDRFIEQARIDRKEIRELRADALCECMRGLLAEVRWRFDCAHASRVLWRAAFKDELELKTLSGPAREVLCVGILGAGDADKLFRLAEESQVWWLGDKIAPVKISLAVAEQLFSTGENTKETL